MENIKQTYNTKALLSGLSSAFLFTISLFLIGIDAVMAMRGLTLTSVAFIFLIFSASLVFYTFKVFEKADQNIKRSILSFAVSYLTLLSFSFFGLFVLTKFGDANLYEVPSFAIVFLPTIFLYSLLHSLAELIHTHTIKYTLFFTSLLSLCLLTSMYFHFWLFHWFLIFLIIHYSISVLKLKKTLSKN